MCFPWVVVVTLILQYNFRIGDLHVTNFTVFIIGLKVNDAANLLLRYQDQQALKLGALNTHKTLGFGNHSLVSHQNLGLSPKLGFTPIPSQENSETL